MRVSRDGRKSFLPTSSLLSLDGYFNSPGARQNSLSLYAIARFHTNSFPSLIQHPRKEKERKKARVVVARESSHQMLDNVVDVSRLVLHSVWWWREHVGSDLLFRSFPAANKIHFSFRLQTEREEKKEKLGEFLKHLCPICTRLRLIFTWCVERRYSRTVRYIAAHAYFFSLSLLRSKLIEPLNCWAIRLLLDEGFNLPGGKNGERKLKSLTISFSVNERLSLKNKIK